MSALSYYVFVGVWSLFVSWWIVFNILPNISFGKKKDAHGGGGHGHGAPAHPVAPVRSGPIEHAQPRRSTHDGFKAYATNGQLSVEDIVKALSRESTR